MKHKIAAIFLLLSVLSSCGENSRKQSGDTSESEGSAMVAKLSSDEIPVIDLNKKYPIKKIILQDIADIEYIPLETRADILVEGSKLAYFSDKSFITYNIGHGDIFIFDSKTGKLNSKFNNTGRGDKEYNQILDVAYDEESGEVYVSSYYRNAILVYSEEGKFLRHLPLRGDMIIERLYNYSADLLLAYNRFYGESEMKDINQQNPYLFLSKRDGNIVSRLETNYSNRLSKSKMISISETSQITIVSSSNNVLKYSDELIIADFASDTIFSYTDRGELIPLFIRTPSVWGEALIESSIEMKIKRLLFFSATPMGSEYLKDMVNKRGIGGFKIDGVDFMFDIKSREIFIPEISNSHSTSGFANYSINEADMAVKDVSVSLINSYQLVESLNKGELSGPLKEMAEMISEDDNPVLMVVRFK